ncbi:MAG: type II toxin-antitoxin system RelE/ParE family toxin [Deltaproteobacteria bacterium]|nr:type II toxin-antitoxin system RelE/ParE family toxin [Deltaproteobacteria bacterium]
MTARRHRVVWTEAAAQDLVQIAIHVADESPATARKLIERLRTRASRLSAFPGRGRVVPELAGAGVLAYREIISRPYRILYRRQDRNVIIAAVIDGRRDLEDVLFERLVR